MNSSKQKMHLKEGRLNIITYFWTYKTFLGKTFNEIQNGSHTLESQKNIICKNQTAFTPQHSLTSSWAYSSPDAFWCICRFIQQLTPPPCHHSFLLYTWHNKSPSSAIICLLFSKVWRNLSPHLPRGICPTPCVILTDAPPKKGISPDTKNEVYTLVKVLRMIPKLMYMKPVMIWMVCGNNQGNNTRHVMN